MLNSEIMSRFSIRGKGYRIKLEGFVRFINAIVFHKILKLHDLRYRLFNKTSKCEKSGNWFLNLSEFKNMLGKNSECGYAILKESSKVLEGKFAILGCSLTYSDNEIKWHLDPGSNFEWGKKYYRLLYPVSNSSKDIDCKMPWELSRFQHLPFLIKGYFSSSNKEYIKETVKQISNWINENRLNYGINWTCAMEVAIRACNWMWAWWAFRDNFYWTDEFNKMFLKSIWEHGWYIEHNLEDKGSIRTNHYLANIVGLLFIGIMFPQFKDAIRWQEFGVRELIRCMDEMVYPDGVSFENSTAYHRLVLEIFTYSAILCRRNGIELPESYWQRLEKMFEFIMYCTRPDGKMPMIGDSDDGRFFLLSNYYEWDRWDHRYLLCIGAVIFNRQDFKKVARIFFEDAYWILGEDSNTQFRQLGNKST